LVVFSSLSLDFFFVENFVRESTRKEKKREKSALPIERHSRRFFKTILNENEQSSRSVSTNARAHFLQNAKEHERKKNRSLLPKVFGHVRRQPDALDSRPHFLLDHRAPSPSLVAEKLARTLHSR
jgi:hypothetical protein